MFGPADGNPVGLGLLIVFGASLFGFTLFLGGAIWIFGRLIECRRGRSGQGGEA